MSEGFIGSFYVTTETLDKILSTLKRKGEKGIGITFKTLKTPTKHGNDAIATVSQTKEQRDNKVPEFVVGYGKQVYPKREATQNVNSNSRTQTTQQQDGDDLPF